MASRRRKRRSYSPLHLPPGAIMVIRNGVGIIGLSISDKASVRPELWALLFDGSDVAYSDAQRIINIEASGYLNNGWELTGDAAKGYALFPLGTTEAVLTKAYRYFRKTYPATFVFDFSTGEISEFATFTRASSATVFGVTGAMASAATNAPRFAYDPVTHAFLGLELEGAGINEALYSESLSQGRPANGGATRIISLTADILSPLGTTPLRLAATAANDSHYTSYYGYNYVIGHTYIFSLYAKAKEYTNLLLGDGSYADFGVTFDLSEGVVLSHEGAGYVNSGMISVGNGWYKCYVIFTASASGSHTIITSIYPDGATVHPWGAFFLGDTTSSGYVWQLQIREGMSPESSIISGATAGTRAADTLTISLPVDRNTLRITFDDNSTQDIAITDPSEIIITADLLDRAYLKQMVAL